MQAFNIKGEGKMDYVVTGEYGGASIANYTEYLFVTNNQGKYSAHSDVGIMTKSISSEGRSWSVPQEIVNTIVESNGFNQNITLWQIIKSWFE